MDNQIKRAVYILLKSDPDVREALKQTLKVALKDPKFRQELRDLGMVILENDKEKH